MQWRALHSESMGIGPSVIIGFSNVFLKGVGAGKFLNRTRDHTLYSYIHI